MKSFHLGDILSITTGFLVSSEHMSGIHKILDFMSGEQLFSHQLPRVSEEACPVLLRQHPQLSNVVTPDKFQGEEHVLKWLEEQVKIYGLHLTISPMTSTEHKRMEPMSELAGMVGQSKIIAIDVDSIK